MDSFQLSQKEAVAASFPAWRSRESLLALPTYLICLLIYHPSRSFKGRKTLGYCGFFPPLGGEESLPPRHALEAQRPHPLLPLQASIPAFQAGGIVGHLAARHLLSKASKTRTIVWKLQKQPRWYPTQSVTAGSNFSVFLRVQGLYLLRVQNAWYQKELHALAVGSIASPRELSSSRLWDHEPLRFNQMQLPQEWA